MSEYLSEFYFGKGIHYVGASILMGRLGVGGSNPHQLGEFSRKSTC